MKKEKTKHGSKARNTNKTLLCGALTASLRENILTGFKRVAESPDQHYVKIILALTRRRDWKEDGLE